MPYVDNWATCDMTSPKCLKNDLPALLRQIPIWMASDHAYTVRFGLLCLMRHKNIVMSREQLLVKCWGYDYEGDIRAVDTHIKRLREKLEGVSDKWNLKTVWGVGYKFEILE